jgi:hypothetical protein
VDPKERPVDLLAALAATAKGARRANPSIMLAVVYSKSDEYGSMDATSLRVFEKNRQLAEADRLCRTDASGVIGVWESFVDSVAPRATGDKWAETRRVVLNQTRELWTSLVCDTPGYRPFINGYFVCADPADQHLQPLADRSLLQLFGDFYGFFVDIMT